MHVLAATKPDEVIDILSERLAFERTAVRLYDRILAWLRSSADTQVQRMLGEMQTHREEEKEHEEWLEAQIRALGGTAHEETERSKLVTRESQGLEEVVMNDGELSHLLHALLAVELVDNAGWDLLVQVADEAGDRDAKRDFKRRLHEEEDHLIFVRKAVEKLSVQEVLGQHTRLPSSTEGAMVP
jgi:bacterioferritin (cytochrome b1)